MNKLLVVMAACALAAAAPSFAADTAAAPNAQQEKMKACNAKAEGKTGDERKQFMSSCLSAKPAPASMSTDAAQVCRQHTPLQHWRTCPQRQVDASSLTR